MFERIGFIIISLLVLFNLPKKDWEKRKHGKFKYIARNYFFLIILVIGMCCYVIGQIKSSNNTTEKLDDIINQTDTIEQIATITDGNLTGGDSYPSFTIGYSESGVYYGFSLQNKGEFPLKNLKWFLVDLGDFNDVEKEILIDHFDYLGVELELHKSFFPLRDFSFIKGKGVVDIIKSNSSETKQLIDIELQESEKITNYRGFNIYCATEYKSWLVEYRIIKCNTSSGGRKWAEYYRTIELDRQSNFGNQEMTKIVDKYVNPPECFKDKKELKWYK